MHEVLGPSAECDILLPEWIMIQAQPCKTNNLRRYRLLPVQMHQDLERSL